MPREQQTFLQSCERSERTTARTEIVLSSEKIIQLRSLSQRLNAWAEFPNNYHSWQLLQDVRAYLNALLAPPITRPAMPTLVRTTVDRLQASVKVEIYQNPNGTLVLECSPFVKTEK